MNTKLVCHFDASFSGEIEISDDEIPNECPICNNKIIAQPVMSYTNDLSYNLMCLCPNTKCNNMFISNYGWTAYGYKFIKSEPKKFYGKKFDDNVEELSEDFVRIYNQAKQAESMSLDDIAGVGYRKALEFLIKDYCISENPTEKTDIEKKLLMQCIKEFIDSVDIKDCAERAVWLGNDETHYARKWINKDIKDLKNLIELTCYWISMKLLTKHYKGSMETGKK